MMEKADPLMDGKGEQIITMTMKTREIPSDLDETSTRQESMGLWKANTRNARGGKVSQQLHSTVTPGKKGGISPSFDFLSYLQKQSKPVTSQSTCSVRGEKKTPPPSGISNEGPVIQIHHEHRTGCSYK